MKRSWLCVIPMALAACFFSTEAATDPCAGSGALRNQMTVTVSVSADSSPIISWAPARCGASNVQVWRSHGDSIVPVWELEVTNNFHGDCRWPPSIHPAMRYGLPPDSAVTYDGPVGVAVGDSLIVALCRQGTPGGPYATAQLAFVVGQGSQP